MFDLSMSVGELIARAVIVYLFIFVVLKFGGKKHVGDLSPFDLVVLLILSETVSGALIGEDNSVIGGLISAATLLFIVHVMDYAAWRSKKAERLFEGTPVFFQCTCSRERVAGILQALGGAEVHALLAERGDVEVRCEFCNRAWRFDAVDVAALFSPGASQPAPPGLH